MCQLYTSILEEVWKVGCQNASIVYSCSAPKPNHMSLVQRFVCCRMLWASNLQPPHKKGFRGVAWEQNLQTKHWSFRPFFSPSSRRAQGSTSAAFAVLAVARWWLDTGQQIRKEGFFGDKEKKLQESKKVSSFEHPNQNQSSSEFNMLLRIL